MDTIVTTSAELAAKFVRQGEPVAFPTETVYGLGADAFDGSAIQRIYRAKGRPADNPLIVHISHLNQIPLLARSISDAAQRLITQFFPGSLTLILSKHPRVLDAVTAGLPTIGVRMPLLPVAQQFIAACGCPIAAPSANRSGRPSPTTWEAVYQDMNGRIRCILKGDKTQVGLESTVVDCTGTTPVVLRTGAVTVERLQNMIPDILIESVDPAILSRSPGTKYRHYAPNARVILVKHPDDIPPGSSNAFIGIHSPEHASRFVDIRICSNVHIYASELFHFFRHCDARGVDNIYCETVKPVGLGLALMDRLQRASDS